ncbi:MAG: hypothetical protein L3J16_05750 [Anaerolineales bacterium]|nr:hypothetical protein [Anaerolineales bacterium]
MKKTLIVLLVVVAMFAAVAPAYAAPDAGKGPGNGGNGAVGTNGSILSNYMTDAMASVLGVDAADLAARLNAGETFYTIALAKGYTAEELPALFSSVRDLATEMAAADGLTPYAMQGQMQGRGQFNAGTGMGYGANGSPQFDPALCAMSGTNAAAGGFRGGQR